MNLLERKPLISKNIIKKQRNEKILLLDKDNSNWVVVSSKLAKIILKCNGTKTVEDIIKSINIENNPEVKKKLISIFEKLYNLKFFLDSDIKIITQSNSLDSLYFNLTKQCNLKCIYCYANAKNKDLPVKDFIFWKDIIDQIFVFNKNATIVFTGGEATLHKDFWEIVDYAKKRGLKIELITNANNYKENEIFKFIEYFNKIEVSIDSLREEINQLTRGKNSLKPALNFIEKLIDNNFKPTIMVVVSKLNSKYINDFLDNFGNNAFIRFQPLYNMGRGEKLLDIGITGKEYYNILDNSHIEKMNDEFSYKRNMKYSWCGMGKNVLSIEYNGIVYPCQLMHDNNFIMGDLNKQMLEEIWEKSPYRELTTDSIETCKDCELKYICSAPCRARAYYMTGSIYNKDPLCPDFIKRSIYDNLFNS